VASLTRTRAKTLTGGWRLPYTFHPNTLGGYSAMFAANDAYYFRVVGSGPISKIAFIVQTQSGNISVAVLRGLPGDNAPSTRLATSGTVACPAAGYAEVSLGGTVTVDERTDWFAISCDNTTATFPRSGAAASEVALGSGFCYRGTTNHPIPASPTGLLASVRFAFVLVGKP
jgi:hypothetical protein